MKIFKVSQNTNTNFAGVYAEFVVIAENAEAARKIHPEGANWDETNNRWHEDVYLAHVLLREWETPDKVIVTQIGESDTPFEEVVSKVFCDGGLI